MKKTITATIGLIAVMLFISIFFFPKKMIKTNSYENITTPNNGTYIVRNVVYTGNDLELTTIGKTMNQIRSECNKPCKINLYADRKAYEIDTLWETDNFEVFTAEQSSYMKNHLIAFWGIDDGDAIEFYPLK